MSWSSKKQCVVAHSSTEVEYCALTKAYQTMWLKSLLNEHGFKLPIVPTLLCDNLVKRTKF